MTLNLFNFQCNVFVSAVLLQTYKDTASKDSILSQTSRWFSNACDRDGGRKERQLSKQAQEQIPEI